VDGRGPRLAEQLGMQVSAAILPPLPALDAQGVRLRPRIVAGPGHDPAHLLARVATGDREATTVDLAGDMEARCRPADGGELLAEPCVERREVAREADDRPAPAIERHRASVDVELLWRLDAGMGQRSVGGALEGRRTGVTVRSCTIGEDR